MEESNSKEPQKCAGCLNNIGEEDYVSALGQDWHKDCFRCSVCDAALSSWYFEKNGLLFCQPDYWERYGDCCQQCTQVITGPVMVAGAHRFHPECFACARCGAPIEDAEPYALVERTRLYCGGCYCSGGGSHSIRVVSVPSSALRVEPAPANTLTVTEYDSSCGAVTLHIGDRILEINGAPPRASALDVRPPTLLQLTIEHNPDTTRNRKIMCNILPDKQANTDIKIPEEKDQKTSTDHNNEQKSLKDHNNQQKTLRDYSNQQKTLTDYGNQQKTLTDYGNQQKTLTDNNNQQKTLTDPNNQQKTTDNKCPKEPKIPTDLSITDQKTDQLEKDGRRERLFKRKGEDGGKTRVIKRRQTPTSPLLGEKERSSSMSKLLDVCDNYPAERDDDVLCELSRARSFRAQPEPQQKVFRASDLIQGELLGSGFFGEVYKVTHRVSGDVMVLKQLYRVDDDAQRNFLKEVAVLRSLSHRNVLRFVGVVYKDKRLHLVTEYVAGGTLHQLIQDSSISLSWSERARLARDVSAGVGYLHRRNVIHRDLNSHNCLVREDKTVIVADFGLARIVQRTASSTLQRGAQHNTLRRKRYTVVGNPYWMAPEMMNGKVYDEKVDVFSFGVILCEIIGRVSADPDFLPRRSDFGLNEALFIEKFCRPRACPEPFYRVAFRACQLDPDMRPPFEVIEIWLESLVMDLSRATPPPPTLLADILSYAHSPHSGPTTPDCHDTCHCQNTHSIQERIPCQRNGENRSCCQQEMCCHCESTYSQQEQCCVHAYSESYGGGGGGVCRCRVRRVPSNAGSEDLLPDAGLEKSKSNAIITPEATRGRALGKCVSASHICARAVTVTSLSRSHNALANPGFILRAVGKSINITKVDDISEWLDSPPPLKRTSPDAQLNRLPDNKARKVDDSQLPAFLRNQSVEGLESKYKQDLDSASLSRHGNLHPASSGDDSDSSDDELICNWYRNVSNSKKMDLDKNVITNIIKKGENLLKKTSYDVADVMLRNPECCNERKFPEEDQRRFNIDYMKRTPIMAEGLKQIPKAVEVPKEKTNFFSKKLLSPKLTRLFKPNTTEVLRNKVENENKMINKGDDIKEEKSRSKFFIQRPISPNITRSSYRVRPVDEPDRKQNQGVLKSDIKLANMGKPMTPTFRRHLPNERPDFVDTRFSYRVNKPKFEPKTEPKFVDVGRNRIKAPLPIEKRIRTAQNQTKPKESSDDKPKRREGISRSNYVSLANLKINSKGLDDKVEKKGVPSLSP